jgi:hypothetical protein
LSTILRSSFIYIAKINDSSEFVQEGVFRIGTTSYMTSQETILELNFGASHVVLRTNKSNADPETPGRRFEPEPVVFPRLPFNLSNRWSHM